jgi:hypothetical protein
MIETPTVLILGAGASVPFGFPTGRKLVKDVCDSLQPGTQLFKLMEYYRFSDTKIQTFRETLNGSRKPSVDAFLERNPQYLEIGKLAIVHILLSYEKTSILFPEGKETWYDYLYNKLSDVPFDNFQNNNISIITFNYDRSFEHYIMTTLKKFYNKRQAECIDKVNSLQIIHVYGKLGYLPWEDFYFGVQYGSNLDPDDLNKAKDKIKIIPETDIDTENDQEFINARQVLKRASQVYFIGFGYHKTNLGRLNIHSLLRFDGITGFSRKNIQCTAYELSEQQKKDVEDLFNINVKINFHSSNVDAYKFIKNVPLK